MTTPADRIKASDTWPACSVWKRLGCLCRGALWGKGNRGTCARKRQRDANRKAAK